MKLFTADDAGTITANNGGVQTVEQWVVGLQTSNAALFAPSKGGGAPPGTGGDAPRDTRKVVSAGDPEAFGKNLESIANGTAVVR